jgi:hypothetical protein
MGGKVNWFTLADWIGAIVALLVGISIGRSMRPTPPKPLQAVCSCEHGYGQHEDVGKCHGQVRRATKWNSLGDEKDWTWVQCPCQRYDGPNLELLGHGPMGLP